MTRHRPRSLSRGLAWPPCGHARLPSPRRERTAATAAEAAPLAAADIAAIRAADSASSPRPRRGDGAGGSAMYAADARLMPPNARPSKGGKPSENSGVACSALSR